MKLKEVRFVHVVRLPGVQAETVDTLTERIMISARVTATADVNGVRLVRDGLVRLVPWHNVKDCEPWPVDEKPVPAKKKAEPAS